MNKQTHTNNKITHKIKFWVGILLAQFFLFYLLSKSTFFIELNVKIFEIQKSIHQKIFSTLNFSFGDLLYIIIIILFFICLFNLIVKRHKKYLVILLVTLNILYPLYQIFWGLLYFQEPILPQAKNNSITEKQLQRLAYKYLKNCIELRQAINENKTGVFESKSIEKLTTEIVMAQSLIPKEFKGKKTTSIISIKKSLFSPIMSYTGILGYYNPFTSEAQYNNRIPHTKLPITIAHESAHQLGYATEQEASFIGFLICKNALNVELKYSANYYALQNILKALSKTDKKLVEEIIKNYSDGMKNDRNYEREFFLQHNGQLTKFFSFANDLFLKYNQQEGSVTYSYFINLLVTYESL